MLALLGLSIAIIGLIGLVSISAGIKMSVTDIVSSMEGISVIEKGAIDDTFSSLPLEYADKIRTFPEVKVVVPTISGTAKDIEGISSELEFAAMGGIVGLVGIDPMYISQMQEDTIYNPKIIKGRTLKPSDKNAIVISESLADDYDKTVGSKLKMKDIKFSIVGVFQSDSQMLNQMIYAPIDTVRDFMGKEKDTVSTFYVELKNPKDADKLAQKIEFRLDDVDAMTSTEFTEQLGSIIGNLEIFFIMISSIAVFVGAIGILNTMLMSVMERTKEFGILKALGWTSTDIMRLIVYESFFLGIIGGVIGCLLGISAVQVMNELLPFPAVAPPDLVITAFFLGVILGVIGGLYPARKASKMDPIEAIRFG